MSKELYEATIEYTKDYNGESWVATISDEKYIDMDTFERVKADIEAKLAEKDEAIENWQTMYESVVQTCHNDKEEIERLNKRLETQENTITNLVEDNRASQEWYKKQLTDSESRFQAHKQNDARIIQDQTDLIENLKQQVKEKDEKIEKLKIENHALMSDNAYQQADIFELNSFKEYYKNNKITFCIEQLEKVKETTECVLDNALKNSSLNQSYYDRLLDEIDNQIKAIKEKK